MIGSDGQLPVRADAAGQQGPRGAAEDAGRRPDERVSAGAAGSGASRSRTGKPSEILGAKLAQDAIRICEAESESLARGRAGEVVASHAARPACRDLGDMTARDDPDGSAI